MMNETARLAQWVLPIHSPLEAWGDYEPWTGIPCLMQPTMGALHDTRHSGDIFLSLAAQAGRPLAKAGERLASFREWLRRNWRPSGTPAVRHSRHSGSSRCSAGERSGRKQDRWDI